VAVTLQQESNGVPRITPACPYVGACGGCQLQDLAYDDQARFKHQQVQQLLGSLAPKLAVEFIACEDPWRYRNKAELSFGMVEGQVVVGFHAARSFARIVQVDECLLVPESFAPIWQDVQRLARQTGESAYHPRTHQGVFRYLVLRQSRATGQILALIVTAPADQAMLQAMAQALAHRHPQIASVYWGTTARLADVSTPEQLTLLHGQPDLEEQIGPFRIRVHPLTFLQPNLRQAERLYTTLTEWIVGDRSKIAWDLYCGVGLVGMYLADRFAQVYGIDVDVHNLALARANAATNGFANLQFHAGSAEEVLANKRFWLLEAKPDVVVVDPPRAGLHPRVISAILGARPRQLVCVSCNPQVLARDLQQLTHGFPRYRLTRAAAFDLFPQTTHVEVAVLLER